jgi:hypothetical protein
MSNGGGGSGGGGGNDSGIGDRTYTYAIGSNHNQYKKIFKKKNRIPRAQMTGLASSGPVFGHR